jgi:hypothetical protein
MVAADYSKCVVTEGRLVTEPFAISCGIVCSGWPSWAIAAKVWNWSIKVIIIKNNLWSSEIKSLFPNVMFLDCMEFEAGLSLGLSVQFWLSDIDPPRKLSVFCSDAVTGLVTCRRVGDFRAGEWIWQVIKLSHAECGGTTDGVWNFHVYKRSGTAALDTPLPLPPRDLSGILNVQVQGIPCRPPSVTGINSIKIIPLSVMEEACILSTLRNCGL